jgi:subtilisin-like proprotein convertase family protein
VASGACTSATNQVALTLYNPTTATALSGQTNCFGRNATFSTSASGTGPFTYVWRKDGVVIEGESSNSITVANLKASDVGTYTVEVTGHCNSVSRSAYLAIESAGLVSPASFGNTAAIVLDDFSPANPYPSSIEVFCVPKPLTSVTVTISNLSHTYGTDIDILLLSPSGKAIMLMSDAGSSYAVNDATLVFSDATANPLPALAPVVTGFFKPTNHGDSDNIPLPAPLGPYVTSLSELNGTDANGTWSLFVIDDAKVDTGIMAGGWSMVLAWEVTPPSLSTPTIRPDGCFQALLHGQAGKTYVIEGSSDYINWIPVSTNTLSGATGAVVDPENAISTQKFYRAVYQP